MAEQIPNIDKVDPRFQQMHGFTVAEGVVRNPAFKIIRFLFLSHIYIFINDILRPGTCQLFAFTVYKQGTVRHIPAATLHIDFKDLCNIIADWNQPCFIPFSV